jgi:subtilisin family serine protease
VRAEKIDPSLLGLLEDLDTSGQEALTAHTSMLGFEQGGEEAMPIPSVNTFIRYESQKLIDELGALGVRVHSARRGICTATVPLVALAAVSDHDAVQEIEAARYLRLSMDVALPAIHVPAYRARTSTSGKNVVVGVIDSGIDPTHVAFGSRIDRVWDQTQIGTGTSMGAYGVELQGAAISQVTDTNGHGTHVAGIAAGADPIFSGVAPDATLVIVKTTMQNTHIGDGVRYVFDVAKKLGDLPAVVNLSLGGHFDPHDGTDPLSLLIDGEAGPGRIVCCAAGNEGTDDIHGQVVVNSVTPARLRFAIPPNVLRVALLNGWYQGGTALEVSVETPSGAATPFQPVAAVGTPATVTHTLPGARVRIATPTVNPGNGDMRFVVEMFGPGLGTPVPGGQWRLHLRHSSGPTTTVDVWALDDVGGETRFTGAGVSGTMKIGSPGTSSDAVTVASFTTKVAWIDMAGQAQQVGLALNDISSFSSDGPLRNGAQKPDLAAPGAMIAAALSSQSSPPARMKLSSDFRVNAGTSMATPFVTGLVALMLEQDNTLDPAAVKATLTAQCRIPRRPPGTFDRKWGFGLIDAQNL